jgi:hypothetical protein
VLLHAGAGAAWAAWLHLPAMVAALICCAAAIECWPTFAQRRPGADWLLRLLPPPLFGCGAAMLGALCALALLLLPLGTLAGALAPPPHAQRTLPAGRAPIVRAPGNEVTFAAGGCTAIGLELRPIALLPTGPLEPTRLQMFADDRPLLDAPVAISGTRQLVRLPLAAVRIDTLRVRSVGGSLPLLFPAGAVVLIEAEPRSGLGNGALAAGCYLLAAAATLAVGALAAPFVALPVAWTLLLAALLLQTLGGLGPVSDAVDALLRGHWLGTAGVLEQCRTSLGIGLPAMILAMLARGRLRR